MSRYPVFIFSTLFWYSLFQPWLPTWLFALYSILATQLQWFVVLSPPIVIAAGITPVSREMAVPLFAMTVVWSEVVVYVFAGVYRFRQWEAMVAEAW